MANDYEFGQYLLSEGYIDKQQLVRGLEIGQANGKSLGEVLVETEILSSVGLAEAVRRYLDIPELQLTQVIIDPNVAGLIPEEVARRYSLIPLELKSGILKVAMSDPTHERALRDVRILSGFEIEPVYAQAEEIQAAISQFLTVEQSVAQLAPPSNRLLEEQSSWTIRGTDLDLPYNDAPTLRLVRSVLHEAIRQGASDIHWEPHKNDFVVRYRIDGKLVRKHVLSSNAVRSVISCLKVMAQMNVAERRIPQDGRMTMRLEFRSVDLRMASMPTVFGEKVVVRILDPEMAQRPLNALGMRPEVESGLKVLLKRPNGLILVVGPTGSGKTTTLYALLRELNVEEQNIISIEDPVEYQLPGVNQVQVNLPAGLSFAVGLRHVLRQDPDVIMIGEIRDEETARIALTASLTGHLVFSTLHTNTAAEALVRLIDMGIEPYLLAAAVSGVLSQRLVRHLCEHCKTPYQVSENEKRALGLSASASTGLTHLYQPAGCSECLATGFRGRIGIHEFLQFNQEIRELVLARQNSQEIEQQATVSGMVTLLEDGLLKVAQGITTVEEVLQSTSGLEE